MTSDQEKMLREVHECLVGNPTTDTTGLIKRVRMLEEYKASDKKLKYKIAGAMIAIGAFWEFIKHKIGL